MHGHLVKVKIIIYWTPNTVPDIVLVRTNPPLSPLLPLLANYQRLTRPRSPQERGLFHTKEGPKTLKIYLGVNY